MRLYIKAWIFIGFVGTCFLACDTSDKLTSSECAKDTVTILTHYSPTTYYIGRLDKPEGFEYELALAFSKYLKLSLKVKILDHPAEVLSALKAGRGDLAAAGLTRTQAREELFPFGPTYATVTQHVVCHQKTPTPKKRKDLLNLKLVVADETSYVERLTALKKKMPTLRWTVSEEDSTESLLEDVWRRKIQCTVADDSIIKVNQRYYPELRVGLALTSPEPLAWPLAKKCKRLRTPLKKWFSLKETQKKLVYLTEKYFGFVRLFDYVDVRTYRRKIKTHMPNYRSLFVKEATKYGFAWTLFAAQAYQESRWNPQAKSPTGVRGLMMLTQNTAKSLGITDRLDPEQSMAGGAKYLERMRRRLPKKIKEPARTWFALAAYNVGFAHLKDAQTLAKRLWKNPYSWTDMQDVLPLLSKARFYKTLKYGYARGLEPVRYVKRIRDYEDILLQELGKR